MTVSEGQSQAKTVPGFDCDSSSIWVWIWVKIEPPGIGLQVFVLLPFNRVPFVVPILTHSHLMLSKPCFAVQR